MKPKDTNSNQLVLGAMIFNIAWGIPLCLYLSARHAPLAYILFPVVLGLPILLVVIRSTQGDTPPPASLSACMVLYFLQMCCVGWMLPQLFESSKAVGTSNGVVVPLVMYFILGFVRRGVWARYKKASGQ